MELHCNLAASPFDHADDGGARAYEALAVQHRHEINQRYRAAFGLKYRFEYHCVAAIAAFDTNYGLGRRDRPTAVVFVAEQRGKASVAVESRPTQPID